MIDILISFLTFVLILVSLFLVLVILMQRANTNSGMGSAFGGGVTESAFGADTTNILTRATKYSAFAFFIIALVLYLLYMSLDRLGGETGDSSVPEFSDTAEPAATVPAETAPVEAAEAVPANLPESGEVPEQEVPAAPAP
jgi:preprotein translocase subunit SecG